VHVSSLRRISLAEGETRKAQASASNQWGLCFSLRLADCVRVVQSSLSPWRYLSKYALPGSSGERSATRLRRAPGFPSFAGEKEKSWVEYPVLTHAFGCLEQPSAVFVLAL